MLFGRTLTSAWIETPPFGIQGSRRKVALSRVRGLKLIDCAQGVPLTRRTLTSAWIETVMCFFFSSGFPVALSRVRGLKHLFLVLKWPAIQSHSHECVD